MWAHWKRGFAFLWASLAIVFAATATAQTQPPHLTTPLAEIPAEAFARLPAFEKAVLSPNGKWMASLASVNGGQLIAMTPLAEPGAASVFAAVPEEMSVDRIVWVNDDNILIIVRALIRVSQSADRWYVTRALSMNRTTKKITKLLWDLNGQNGADLLWIAADGSPDVLIAAQASIFTDEIGFWPAVSRVNVETGKRTVIQTAYTKVLDWYADGGGAVRVGLSTRDDGRQVDVVYRAPSAKTWRTIDRANVSKQETVLKPFLIQPNADQGLAISTDGAGRDGVYEVDLTTLKLGRAVYEAPQGAGEVDYAIVSSDRTELLGVAITHDGGSVAWLDPKLKAAQAFINENAKKAQATILSWNKDRTQILAEIGTPDSAGMLFLYDVGEAGLIKLVDINPNIGARRLSPAKFVRYAARDGLEIEAVLTLPRGAKAEKLPLIVLPHGGPWAHDTLSYDYVVQFLASRGYGVLQPNFRGSTGYGDAFLRKGEGQLGLAMQDDLTDGLKWAVAQGIADPARVCIVGFSYGGYAAMWGVAKDPDLYRCAISISGVANLRREVNAFSSSLRGGLYRDQWQRMAPDFPAVSPINAVNRIKAPMLLIHGKKDITVDHAQSVQMEARMRAAGKPVDFLSMPLADHYFTREPDRVALLNAMAAFLAKHNPAGAPPPK